MTAVPHEKSGHFFARNELSGKGSATPSLLGTGKGPHQGDEGVDQGKDHRSSKEGDQSPTEEEERDRETGECSV